MTSFPPPEVLQQDGEPRGGQHRETAPPSSEQPGSPRSGRLLPGRSRRAPSADAPAAPRDRRRRLVVALSILAALVVAAAALAVALGGGAATYWAASRGKTAALRFLLDLNPAWARHRVHSLTSMALSPGRFPWADPLCGAASNGQLDAIDLLVERSAPLDGRNEVDNPIFAAAQNGQRAAVARLLSLRARPNRPSLWMAARALDYAMLQILAPPGRAANDPALADDYAATLGAGPGGVPYGADPAIVELMLRAGANVDSLPARMLLARAIGVGDAVVEQLLLDAGVDLARAGAAEYLFEHARDDAAVDRLVAAGADLESRRGVLGTAPALLVAAQEGHEPVALALVRRGADPNPPGVAESPLHWAVRRQLPRLVRALIDAGARLDEKSHWGQTPLDLDTTPEISAMLREAASSASTASGASAASTAPTDPSAESPSP